MIIHKGLPILIFPTQAAWDEWLAERGPGSPGTWL